MQRILLMTFGTLFLGAVTLSPATRLMHRAFASPAVSEQAIAGQIDRALERLHLYTAADPPGRRSQYRLLVSESPLTPERCGRLCLHRPDFEVWRGTVAIYVGALDMCQDNYDPDYPERYASWAGSYVYGDPELIARLQSCR